MLLLLYIYTLLWTLHHYLSHFIFSHSLMHFVIWKWSSKILNALCARSITHMAGNLNWVTAAASNNHVFSSKKVLVRFQPWNGVRTSEVWYEDFNKQAHIIFQGRCASSFYSYPFLSVCCTMVHYLPSSGQDITPGQYKTLFCVWFLSEGPFFCSIPPPVAFHISYGSHPILEEWRGYYLRLDRWRKQHQLSELHLLLCGHCLPHCHLLH